MTAPDDDLEHFPWSYTEFGIECACGSPMNRDEECLTEKVRAEQAEPPLLMYANSCANCGDAGCRVCEGPR